MFLTHRVRLEIESELLHLPAYATATLDPCRVCDPHHSSRQCWIPNPLNKGRDRTRNLMVPSQIHFHCATTGTHRLIIFIQLVLLRRKGSLKKQTEEFLSWRSGYRIRLGTVRLWVQSLPLLSGLMIRPCRELWCGSQTRLGSHVAVALA